MFNTAGIKSLGGKFTSISGPKKVQRIELTFQDQVFKHKTKNSTFQRKYFPWVRIDQLKKDLSKNYYNNKVQWQQLRLFCKNIELDNNKRFFDNNVEQQNDIIIQKVQNTQMPLNGIINPYKIFKVTPKEIMDLIMAVESGLNAGRKPKLSEEGTSGTYFLENHQKKKIAIFKPHDEEPFTPSNPRGYIGNLGGNGIRKGILSGQAATRQVAAYLLDTNSFHRVPPTTYVQFYHPSFNYKQIINSIPIVSGTETDLKTLKTKHGSLQEFVQSHDVAGNLGAHQFDKDQVHKIGILDLRILNCDRNQANILVKKVNVIDQKTKKQTKKIIMTPIDHGLSFPDNFEIYQYQMVWMSYPQAKAPFSQKSLDFIKNIDPDEDCRTLRDKLGFREICLRNFKIAQIFLKKMALQDFTLYDIGSRVYRQDDDSDSDQSQEQNDENEKKQTNQKKSQLQKLIQRTEQIYNLVKQNGIRSTVEFQIGLIKMRKEKQQSLNFLQQKRIESSKFKQIIQEKQEQNQNENNGKSHEQLTKINKKYSQQSNLLLKNNQFIQSKPIQNHILQNSNSHTNKSKHQKQTETSIQKMQHIMSLKKSLPKIRNVSLPHLKKTNSGKNRRINKKQKQLNQKQVTTNWKKNQKWEEIFFHYFEDLLEEYIKKAKNKKLFNDNKKKIIQRRERFMSESIDPNQLN